APAPLSRSSPQCRRRPARGRSRHRDPEAMVRLIVEAPAGSYPVVIGSNMNRELRGTVARLDPTAAAIVTDTNVLPWAKKVARAIKRAGVKRPIHVIRPGEHSKSMAALGDVLAFLERQKVDRGGCVIAVGGGTVGDL